MARDNDARKRAQSDAVMDCESVVALGAEKARNC